MIKQLFYRKGKFHPPYMYIIIIFILLVLIIATKYGYALYSIFDDSKTLLIPFPISDELIMALATLFVGKLWIYRKNGKPDNLE